MAKGAKDFVDAYTFNISQHKNFDLEMDGLSSMVAYYIKHTGCLSARE